MRAIYFYEKIHGLEIEVTCGCLSKLISDELYDV